MAIFDNLRYGVEEDSSGTHSRHHRRCHRVRSSSRSGPGESDLCKSCQRHLCELEVPWMHYDAVRGQPCTNSQFPLHIRARTNGETPACVPDPHSGGVAASWARSAPLFGVQPIGAACPSWMGGAVAQAPDGRSLVRAEGARMGSRTLSWHAEKGTYEVRNWMPNFAGC
jgi:hypothetical protein